MTIHDSLIEAIPYGSNLEECYGLKLRLKSTVVGKPTCDLMVTIPMVDSIFFHSTILYRNEWCSWLDVVCSILLVPFFLLFMGCSVNSS